MARESKRAKAARALKILEALDAHMPDARIELSYTTPLELLTAVLLSAQCTDKRVNMVTPALFARFPSAEAYAASTPEEIEPYIQTCGLFHNKAKNLASLGRALVAEHGGQVPTSVEALQKLPGVGRKTAGVVAIHLGSPVAFPVDTHVHRLSRRLELSSAKDPAQVERDLQALVPPEWWTKGHQLLIWHGRRTCAARAPACARCVVRELCPSVGASTRPKGKTVRPERRHGVPKSKGQRISAPTKG